MNSSILLNNTAINSPSPFNSTIISYGINNPQHTSTAQPVYTRATLLTPWPYIVADILLSLILTAWTYYSASQALTDLSKIYLPSPSELDEWIKEVRNVNYHGKNKPSELPTAVFDPVPIEGRIFFDEETGKLPKLPHPSTITNIIDIASVVITTVRALTICISVAQAIAYNNSTMGSSSGSGSGSGGRFRASTTIYLALTSASIFANDSSKNWWLGRIMELNSTGMAAAIVAMIISKLFFSGQYYGEMFIGGGTCPVAVTECPTTFTQIGCGGSSIVAKQLYDTFDFSKDVTKNLVSAVEQWFGIVMTGAGTLVFLPAYQGSKAVQRRNCRLSREKMRDGVSCSVQKWAGMVKERYKSAYRQKITAGARVTALIVLGAVSVGPHYYQQTMTRGKFIFVVDGYGPAVNVTGSTSTSTSRNGTGIGTGTSWSDCFQVPFVHDRFGFFGVWWDAVEKYPADWVSVT